MCNDIIDAHVYDLFRNILIDKTKKKERILQVVD